MHALISSVLGQELHLQGASEELIDEEEGAAEGQQSPSAGACAAEERIQEAQCREALHHRPLSLGPHKFGNRPSPPAYSISQEVPAPAVSQPLHGAGHSLKKSHLARDQFGAFG